VADRINHSMLNGITTARLDHAGEIVVIGLGRFGSALSNALVEMDYEVLGVDADPNRVQ
jgi:trk system potassium uptake protein TrkA